MIKKIIAFALLFSFIYQISYIFLPFNVPFVMGLIGMPIYLYIVNFHELVHSSVPDP